MKFRRLLLLSTLGLLTGPVFAARTSDSGVALPDCHTASAECREWRQAVEMLNNAGGASMGGYGGERPAKPVKNGPAYLRSVDACVKYHVFVRHMTLPAARARCEKLMANAAGL